MRRFTISADNLHHLPVTIRGTEARHLINVLRLKSGDTVTLLDGCGKAYRAEILSCRDQAAAVRIIAPAPTAGESFLHITVAQAFLKERKMDTSIRYLTELGIDRWLPFVSQRSVARPDEKRLVARCGRWHEIARAAVKQCGRSCIPEITPLPSLEAVLAAARGIDLKIMFWEKEPSKFSTGVERNAGKHCRKVFVLIGPEGGFDENEVRAALTGGFVSAGLGPRILRAETAALTACTLIQYLLGDMGPAAYKSPRPNTAQHVPAINYKKTLDKKIQVP